MSTVCSCNYFSLPRNLLSAGPLVPRAEPLGTDILFQIFTRQHCKSVSHDNPSISSHLPPTAAGAVRTGTSDVSFPSRRLSYGPLEADTRPGKPPHLAMISPASLLGSGNTLKYGKSAAWNSRDGGPPRGPVRPSTRTTQLPWRKAAGRKSFRRGSGK